ncbi:MAG: hypothetical protein CM15mP117_24770 [Alphaproteobacteria bacterium]|nr:MAG: hypothetical protein CM15mP117_24770 [Alphaproteobacteria bacterium]
MLSSFEQKESNPMYQEIQIVINVPEFNEKSKPSMVNNNFDETQATQISLLLILKLKLPL